MKRLIIVFLFFITVTFLPALKQPALSEYEVRFTHTGYTLIHGTLADCQIRSNGKVVLSGFLKGEESGEADDPVLYYGKLHLDIDMDICSAKRLANGEDKLCGMRVIGNGTVNVELELSDSSTNQVSYIKIDYDTTLGRFQKSVNGDCDHAQMVEEENMVPNKTIATIFNGRELPMITTRILGRLVVGRRYVERDGQHETVVEVLRKIR